MAPKLPTTVSAPLTRVSFHGSHPDPVNTLALQVLDQHQGSPESVICNVSSWVLRPQGCGGPLLLRFAAL
eukprot:1141159-Amphidinium_carterae.1